MANIKGWDFSGIITTETFANENELVIVHNEKVIAKVSVGDSDLTVTTQSCGILIDLQNKSFTFQPRNA